MRLVEAAGRVVLGLDEDRGEARRDQQRRGHSPSSSRFRGLSTSSERTSPARRGALRAGSLRLRPARASPPGDGARRSSCSMSGCPDDTRWMTSARPRCGWGMWKRFLLAGVLIVLLSGGATATVALNTVSGLAARGLPQRQPDRRAQGLVTPEYSGGPQTFLILGSDRREGSKDAYDRNDPPHSDTILLVRFDPEQGQTSVLSIPRDLMVNITTPQRPDLPDRKDQRRLHDRQPARRHQGRDGARGRNDRARSVPRTEAERHRRRELRGLHQSRRHARLRLRERRPPLLQREHRARRKPTTRASTCSPAIRSSATKTRSTTCATATPTRTSCASRASRTSCATCASRSRPATSSARSTPSPKRSGTRSARPSTPPPSELIELAKLIAFSQ